MHQRILHVVPTASDVPVPVVTPPFKLLILNVPFTMSGLVSSRKVCAYQLSKSLMVIQGITTYCQIRLVRNFVYESADNDAIVWSRRRGGRDVIKCLDA